MVGLPSDSYPKISHDIPMGQNKNMSHEYSTHPLLVVHCISTKSSMKYYYKLIIYSIQLDPIGTAQRLNP